MTGRQNIRPPAILDDCVPEYPIKGLIRSLYTTPTPTYRWVRWQSHLTFPEMPEVSRQPHVAESHNRVILPLVVRTRTHAITDHLDGVLFARNTYHGTQIPLKETN